MSKSKINKQYLYNKEATVGTDLICPICGTSFVKKQYSQAFCCKECKNKFWNKKGDRHREGYYAEYNEKHPDRGHYIKQLKHNPGTLYYDKLGRAYSRDFYNPTMTDMINWADSRWHDDDWCEEPD
jgi:ribosomal protein L37AE/L43A